MTMRAMSHLWEGRLLLRSSSYMRVYAKNGRTPTLVASNLTKPKVGVQLGNGRTLRLPRMRPIRVVRLREVGCFKNIIE